MSCWPPTFPPSCSWGFATPPPTSSRSTSRRPSRSTSPWCWSLQLSLSGRYYSFSIIYVLCLVEKSPKNSTKGHKKDLFAIVLPRRFNDPWSLQFSVMEKLPPTSYVRLVDIWLINGQLVPFLEVILLTVLELKRDSSTVNHHGFMRLTMTNIACRRI